MDIATVCRRCRHPLAAQRALHTLCDGCAEAFRPTILDVYAWCEVEDVILDPWADFDYFDHAGEQLSPTFCGFVAEYFGVHVTMPAEEVRRRWPILAIPHGEEDGPGSLLAWEVRLLLADRPQLYWRLTYRPWGQSELGMEGFKRPGWRASDVTQLLAIRPQIDELGGVRRRGPQPGYLGIDPEDWRIVMPTIDAWAREGCTMSQIKGRLTKRELTDPDFPTISGRDDGTLRDWLKKWRRENLP